MSGEDKLGLSLSVECVKCDQMIRTKKDPTFTKIAKKDPNVVSIN